MFIAKSTLFIALLSLFHLVAAQSPWCLLYALGAEPDPADLATVCGEDAGNVTIGIRSSCSGNDARAAWIAFSQTCSAAGHPVSIALPSATPASSSVVTSSSAFVTATPTPSSGSSSGSSTGSAGSGSTTSTGSGSSPSISTLSKGAASSVNAGSAAAFAAALFIGVTGIL